MIETTCRTKLNRWIPLILLAGVLLLLPAAVDAAPQQSDPGNDAALLTHGILSDSVAVQTEDDGPTCSTNSDCDAAEYCSKEGFNCEGEGTCELRPEACLLIFDPVCGCDGQTYSNFCFAASAGVNVAFDDACENSPRP